MHAVKGKRVVKKAVGLWLAVELTSAIVALCLLVAAIPAYVTVWIFRMLEVPPAAVPDAVVFLMLAAGVVIAVGLGRIALRIPRDLWREALSHPDAEPETGRGLYMPLPPNRVEVNPQVGKKNE